MVAISELELELALLASASLGPSEGYESCDILPVVGGGLVDEASALTTVDGARADIVMVDGGGPEGAVHYLRRV